MIKYVAIINKELLTHLMILEIKHSIYKLR